MPEVVVEERAGSGGDTANFVEPGPTPCFESRELIHWSFYRAIIAEFMATTLLLYITISTLITHRTAAGDGVGFLGIAWCFGGMIFVLVYCTAGISGGHINPAVTFGLCVARRISVSRTVAYMVAQCGGAICGAAIVRGMSRSFYDMYGGGANFVSSGYSKTAGLGAEVIGTFILVYTVLSATDPKRNARDSHIPVLAPLPIGFAVFIVHLATLPITGTGINPARSLGPAVIYNKQKIWSDHWIFWVGPFVGAFGAAIYHQYILKAAGIKAVLGRKY